MIVQMEWCEQKQSPRWGWKDRGELPDESQASSSSPPGIQSHSKQQPDKDKSEGFWIFPAVSQKGQKESLIFSVFYQVTIYYKGESS